MGRTEERKEKGRKKGREWNIVEEEEGEREKENYRKERIKGKTGKMEEKMNTRR